MACYPTSPAASLASLGSRVWPDQRQVRGQGHSPSKYDRRMESHGSSGGYSVARAVTPNGSCPARIPLPRQFGRSSCRQDARPYHQKSLGRSAIARRLLHPLRHSERTWWHSGFGIAAASQPKNCKSGCPTSHVEWLRCGSSASSRCKPVNNSSPAPGQCARHSFGMPRRTQGKTFLSPGVLQS